MTFSANPRIAVIGLGYVGLPLAVALAREFEVIGLDVDAGRIAELRDNRDRTGEITEDALAHTALTFTLDPEECRGVDLFIVTVPTPVDASNKPDLGPVLSASRVVGGLLDPSHRAVVVFESTVYPGVTEDLCGPALERESGLSCGRHFFLGYSPERINPGDREHTVDRIVKVIAGQTDEVTEFLARVYGAITTAGVFRARSIKAAEAAKVIENAQRDINIAFMNEVAQIFSCLDLSVWDVLDAAGTKWNFLPFQPGLVGGHCIGVDPYYLSFRARQLGHEPQVILAGRETNDGMGGWIADRLHEIMERAGEVLVLGLTFKEDVPDLRNSRIVDVVRRMDKLGHVVTIHDPLASPAEAEDEYGLAIERDALARQYDLVLLGVPHAGYKDMKPEAIEKLVRPGGVIADLKGAWRNLDFSAEVRRWSL